MDKIELTDEMLEFLANLCNKRIRMKGEPITVQDLKQDLLPELRIRRVTDVDDHLTIDSFIEAYSELAFYDPSFKNVLGLMGFSADIPSRIRFVAELPLKEKPGKVTTPIPIAVFDAQEMDSSDEELSSFELPPGLKVFIHDYVEVMAPFRGLTIHRQLFGKQLTEAEKAGAHFIVTRTVTKEGHDATLKLLLRSAKEGRLIDPQVRGRLKEEDRFKPVSLEQLKDPSIHKISRVFKARLEKRVL